MMSEASLDQSSAGLPAVVVVGEVLWDVLEAGERLGGAPLNFAAHSRRYGHAVQLISGLGADERGRGARDLIARCELDTRWLQTSVALATGTAAVHLDAAGSAEFRIPRPAAYDDVRLAASELAALAAGSPGWLYFGTLFAARPEGRQVLGQLFDALGPARRIYDVNLRPGADSMGLVAELLQQADVVKLNDQELDRLQASIGFGGGIEAFCRAGCERYGWQAVTVTRGAHGCAMLVGDTFVEVPGIPVTVADTVGAGDAFAAALVHGLSRDWPAIEIAEFANRAGADVASRAESLPVAALS